MRQNYIRELTKAIHMKEKSLMASSQRFYHLTKLMDAMHDVGSLIDYNSIPLTATLTSTKTNMNVSFRHRLWRRSTCSVWAPSSRQKPWEWSFQRWCRRSLPPSFPRSWQAWWGPSYSTPSDDASTDIATLQWLDYWPFIYGIFHSLRFCSPSSILCQIASNALLLTWG